MLEVGPALPKRAMRPASKTAPARMAEPLPKRAMRPAAHRHGCNGGYGNAAATTVKSRATPPPIPGCVQLVIGSSLLAIGYSGLVRAETKTGDEDHEGSPAGRALSPKGAASP